MRYAGGRLFVMSGITRKACTNGYLVGLLVVLIVIAQTLVVSHFHIPQKASVTPDIKADFSQSLYIQKLQKFLHQYDSVPQQPEQHAGDCELCVLSATPALLSTVSVVSTRNNTHESVVVLQSQIAFFTPSHSSRPRAPPLMLSIT